MKLDQNQRFMVRNYQKGMSIIGVIVAVFIISAGLVAILGLLNSAISASQTSKSRLIASFLVREGIEVVRNIRDTNWLEGEVWNEGIKGTGANERFGIVNYDSQDGFYVSFIPGTTIDSCIADNSCRLYIDASGRYSHNSAGTPTNFYRFIKTDKMPPAENQLQVISQVKWFERGRWYLMEAEDRLWNWK